MSTIMHLAPGVEIMLFAWICHWGAYIFRVIYAVSSCCESRSVNLSLVWFHVATETSVSDVLSPVVWDLVLSNEFNCIRSFHPAVFESLR